MPRSWTTTAIINCGGNNFTLLNHKLLIVEGKCHILKGQLQEVAKNGMDFLLFFFGGGGGGGMYQIM